MTNFKYKQQSGFSVLIVVVIIAFACAITAFAYTNVKESNNKRAAAKLREQSNQVALEAKNKTELKKAEKKPEPTPAPETPPPVTTPPVVDPPVQPPSPAPTPTPIPPAAEPNITPFTYNDNIGCDSYVAAYASRSGGTPLYKDTAGAYNGNGEIYVTIPYGAYLQIKCKDGNAATGLYGITEGIVNTADISKTKP